MLVFLTLAVGLSMLLREHKRVFGSSSHCLEQPDESRVEGTE